MKPTESGTGAHSAVLDRGRDLFREMARLHREGSREAASQRQDLARLALAAVEAVELLSDALAQYATELPQAARETLAVLRTAAMERLEEGGVRFDGAIGEALDLTRHRVLRSRRRHGVERATVAEVLRPGVTIRGVRVREAEVVVEEPERSR